MTIRVLAVDDEANVLRLVQIKLSKAGFDVITARDGEEGLQKAIDEKPDVVILDVMMPKLDGYSVLQRIKTEIEDPPIVIMLTAKGQEADVLEGISTGAEDYVVKPFAPRELIARVNVALIKAGKQALMDGD